MCPKFTISGVKKPFTDKQDKTDAKDRFVSPQPLMFRDNYNMRKIMQLPYHVVYLEDSEKMKNKVLCNAEFLVTKLKATSIK